MSPLRLEAKEEGKPELEVEGFEVEEEEGIGFEGEGFEGFPTCSRGGISSESESFVLIGFMMLFVVEAGAFPLEVEGFKTDSSGGMSSSESDSAGFFPFAVEVEVGV